MLFHSGDVGAITGYIDVAQVVLYLFWIFFVRNAKDQAIYRMAIDAV
ncbi:MAG: hypothetical protein EBV92_09375 [Betaproteobacteria bacterium]|nr:hypothetical protein [Betaproteobacteria bacterium]